jgi:hypothetical protein
VLADCRDAIKSSWILFDKAGNQKNAHWNSEILTGVMRETLRRRRRGERLKAEFIIRVRRRLESIMNHLSIMSDQLLHVT